MNLVNNKNLEPIKLFRNECEINLRLSILETLNKKWEKNLLSNFYISDNGLVPFEEEKIRHFFDQMFDVEVILHCSVNKIIEKLKQNKYVLAVIDSYNVKQHIYYKKVHRNIVSVIYGYDNYNFYLLLNSRMLGFQKVILNIEKFNKILYSKPIDLKTSGIKGLFLTLYPNTAISLKEDYSKIKNDQDIFQILDAYYNRDNKKCGVSLLLHIDKYCKHYIQKYHKVAKDYMLVNALACIMDVKQVHKIICEEYGNKDLEKQVENTLEYMKRIKFALGKYLFTNDDKHIREIIKALDMILRLENISGRLLYEGI